MTRVAVVGMACQYPDATSPHELWENAIAGRRAFRRIPDERLPLADYYDPDPSVPDRFYARNAAVIEGYEFDRIAYKVAGSTYRSTDPTHWLALDVAARALADAGFPMAEGMPRERTAVVVGNTLTGEFSRADTLRLRWPYVRRTLAAALKDQDWPQERLAAFLDEFEASYKRPFPGIDEDTLAGGLSNTIAGRICNHFDLKGGGYTVDGACSSSLLSVATACRSLVDGESDVAVAGGVDLSIDPFEVIGFAKTGALATAEMRVYDRNSNGFWPGEGCGMVVLMREEDARAAGHRVYASIAGWGISSDGKGGMTRPEARGYQLALRRAYERAGFGIDSVALFEGHGTGTQVGDATELTALSEARRQAGEHAAPAAIGSVKAMIGHTKAAAGVAGLIKASMAVHHEVLPPTLGCVEPHQVLADEPVALRVLRKAEPWPERAPVRAGVTAMGFGGINTHLVLENSAPKRRRALDARTRTLASSAQDVELLLIDARTPQALRERLDELIPFVARLAYGQLADLAGTLHHELRDQPYRAAVVVSSPEDAVQRLRHVREALETGETRLVTADGRSFLGHTHGPGRIGFLFPGQGSGTGTSGGALRRRFADVEDIYHKAALPVTGDMIATEVAQPRIVTGTLAGLRVLSTLGLDATVAVGHSLGEISALHWAGALDEDALLRIAAARGRAMNAHSSSGTMAGIAAPPERVEELTADLPVVIAGYNGPGQTVVAGSVDAVQRACDLAEDAGVTATRLSVSHAFHSPLVAPSADALRTALAEETFGAVGRRVVSTVTGAPLGADTDLTDLLFRQITSPVRFAPALAAAAEHVDLFVEVGPGRVLSGLAAGVTEVPAIALDTDDESLAGLLKVVGATYVVGGSRVDPALFHDRLLRPLRVGEEQKFFASPCEEAPPLPAETRAAVEQPRQDPDDPAVAPAAQPSGDGPGEPFELLRRLVAERAELPPDFVHEDSHLLDELHLSSITVGQVMNQAAQELGMPATRTPTNFATATVGELAEALDVLADTTHDGEQAPAEVVAGAATWVRPWSIDLDEQPLPAPVPSEEGGEWQVYADQDRFAESLRRALESASIGGGVLVCLPERCAVEDLAPALHGARRAIGGPDGTRFVLVQPGRGAAGLAKSLRLEAPQVRVSIVHAPLQEDLVDRIVAEVAATTGYTEVHLDADGTRRVPVLRALPLRAPSGEPPAALTDSDVLLVTGGGKGITAECAFAMATDSGAKLALLGRSDPEQDEELATNLQRMTDAGVTVRYARADVTDAGEVRQAVEQVTAELGPVTAVLHGAGRNEPAGLAGLDSTTFRQPFGPKIDGLQVVLDALDPERLTLLVTLGSIIGRAGLRGEAHYATANEWLAHLTAEYAQQHPGCRGLCIEWSVWSGVGMGERLAVVESLARDGVTPVTPGEGVAILRRLLADPDTPPVVLVSGRTEGIETLRYHQPELPLLRFLERQLVRYHGVELVTEVDLSAGSDLYLGDHRLDGNLLFPAVFGLEAMAQVAAAVTGRAPDGPPPVVENAEFLRPIVVPPDGSTTVRIAAVVGDDDESVTVVIHSAETGFAAEHFRATLRYPADAGVPDGPPTPVSDELPVVPIEPATELYGDTLFQGERFQRLRRYHRAAARDVDAELTVEPVSWFSGYLADRLLLGDPGVRDALMHGNQVCVPDATLLPAAVERIHPAGAGVLEAAGGGELRYCATERSHEGDTYVYDIALRTGAGETVERWEGLRLQAVRKKDAGGPWVAPLLGPYLERTVGELLGAEVAVAVQPMDKPDAEADTDPDGSSGYIAQRREHTAIVASHALGAPVEVHYRPDGRPEIGGDRQISAAHGAGLTLCVAAAGPVGCDLEPVAERTPDEWQGLLGPHAALAERTAEATGESLDTAATRVWSAIECLRKADASPDGPVTLLPGERDGWTVFGSGDLQIGALATTVRDHPDPIVFAVLSERRS